MSEWIFPTLSEILASSDENRWAQECQNTPVEDAHLLQRSKLSVAQKHLRAEREWFGAIAALESLLKQLKPTESSHGNGLVLSGPLPVLSQTDLLANFATWSFTADPLATLIGLPFQLLPSTNGSACADETNATLSLLPGDPLAAEPFCLVLTSQFSLAMVLGEDTNSDPAFSLSFDPEIVERVWQTLRLRVVLMNPSHLKQLDSLYEKFSPISPDYKLVTQFSLTLLNHLPEPAVDTGRGHAYSPTEPGEQGNAKRVASPNPSDPLQSLDVELLQAIAHEVRTPLTTIRTMTRSLLKRRDLSPEVVKRLEIIDRECTEQIDRFGLIFRAVEIETSATKLSSESLAPTSLAQVLEQSIPRWQKQASQRNLTLEVILPQQLPPVMSDPVMLDQALTSLIERSARSLPSGSCIQVEVSLAGNQLKLQLQSQVQSEANYSGCNAHNGASPSTGHRMPLLKSLGQVLMFQPETGSLSLNLSVTKNIFHALGGKLIVRQRPEQGEIFTLFLPLEPSKSATRSN